MMIMIMLMVITMTKVMMIVTVMMMMLVTLMTTFGLCSGKAFKGYSRLTPAICQWRLNRGRAQI